MAWVFLQPHTTGSNRKQWLLCSHTYLFLHVIVFLFTCLCVVYMQIVCMFVHVWEPHCVRAHICVCVPVETRGWCWKSSPIALLPSSIREGLSVNLELTDGTHLTSWLDLGIPGLTLRTELEAILTTLSSPSHGLLGSNPILILTWQVLQPLIHLPNTHSHTYTPCLKHKPEGKTRLSTCGVHTVLGLYTFILPLFLSPVLVKTPSWITHTSSFKSVLNKVFYQTHSIDIYSWWRKVIG